MAEIMIDIISNPFGLMLVWFDIGLLLMILGEYWFTVRKGHSIDVTGKYLLKVLGLSFLGPIVLNRIIAELFNDRPEFLTPIEYKEETVDIKDSYTIETCEIIEL